MISRERIGPHPILCVDVAGEGELVLMLHGVGGNRSNWADQLPALADRYMAVAWDARGYGDSEDYEGPLRLSDFSDDVLRVLRHFGASSAHLIGLSMGGRIALDVYRRFPERVLSLVLADTSAGHPSAADPAKIEEALRLRIAPLLAGEPASAIAPELARSMVGEAILPAAYERLMSSLCAIHPQSYIKTMQCLTRDTDFIAFEDVGAPTLVLNGGADRIARPDAARRVAELIPDHRFVLLEGVGHVSNIEAPDRFNNAVLEFLDSLGERPRRREPESAHQRGS